MSETSSPVFADLEAALQQTLPTAQIAPTNLPELPQLTLGLINADFPTGPLPQEVMHAVIANPAYWAFCWGSGLATAQWLLANPEHVQGKRIADLGSGSGVVAIAAKLAGASKVWACDNDPQALLATEVNAAANGVSLHLCADLNDLPKELDLLLMADVLYDRRNFALINAAKTHAHKMIIADSRVADVDDSSFVVTHKMTALTYPNLGEFEEFKSVSFFSYDGPT